MSIVSGLATATGISSLLNAPRDNNLVLRFVAGDPAPQATVKRAEEGTQAATRFETARPVVATSGAAAPAKLLRESRDPRYTQFLDAVMALRTDLSEETLSSQRVAELRKAAKEIFRLEGVPEEKRPVLTEAQVAARRARYEATERAARQQDAEADLPAPDRAETAAERVTPTTDPRLARSARRPAEGVEPAPGRTGAELPAGLVGGGNAAPEPATSTSELPGGATLAEPASGDSTGNALATSQPLVLNVPEPAA